MPRAKARKTCQWCGRRLITAAERLSKSCWDGDGESTTRLCSFRAALRCERRARGIVVRKLHSLGTRGLSAGEVTALLVEVAKARRARRAK